MKSRWSQPCVCLFPSHLAFFGMVSIRGATHRASRCITHRESTERIDRRDLQMGPTPNTIEIGSDPFRKRPFLLNPGEPITPSLSASKRSNHTESTSETTGKKTSTETHASVRLSPTLRLRSEAPSRREADPAGTRRGEGTEVELVALGETLALALCFSMFFHVKRSAKGESSG